MTNQITGELFLVVKKKKKLKFMQTFKNTQKYNTICVGISKNIKQVLIYLKIGNKYLTIYANFNHAF